VTITYAHQTLSAQAVVIILPTIGADLSIPDARLQWIVSAYSLTFGSFLLLWGRIADIFGKRLIFILGCGFISITMIINPFVKNEIAFNVLRGLQGIVGTLDGQTNT
jgi:MFS family permease